MKNIITRAAVYALLLLTPLKLYANPVGLGINKMNSALQDNGVNNPSLGIQFNIPLEKPSDWGYGFYVPKSPNSLCNKPGDTSLNLSNRANPCAKNAESNSNSGN